MKLENGLGAVRDVADSERMQIISRMQKEVESLPEMIGDSDEVDMLPEQLDFEPLEAAESKEMKTTAMEDTDTAERGENRSSDDEQNSKDISENQKAEVKDITIHICNNISEMLVLYESKDKITKRWKPDNAPNVEKWFKNGGTTCVEYNANKKSEEKDNWIYKDADGRTVRYEGDKIIFPQEAKHPIIEDINIGAFSGDRNKDEKKYLEALEREYGLTAIPEGYSLHHSTENGVMQLIKTEYHKEFGHVGGHSLYGKGV